MLDSLKDILSGNTTIVASAVGVIAAYTLKKIPNDAIQKKVDLVMYKLGVFCTLGLAKWTFSANIWNKTVEPYVVDAVDNILITGLQSFIRGLRSDNK
tara:strand:- start:4447 stop:4740 length:294 start_codon:yes stop_codon:yes gene_type:complete